FSTTTPSIPSFASPAPSTAPIALPPSLKARESPVHPSTATARWANAPPLSRVSKPAASGSSSPPTSPPAASTSPTSPTSSTLTAPTSPKTTSTASAAPAALPQLETPIRSFPPKKNRIFAPSSASSPSVSPASRSLILTTTPVLPKPLKFPSPSASRQSALKKPPNVPSAAPNNSAKALVL